MSAGIWDVKTSRIDEPTMTTSLTTIGADRQPKLCTRGSLYPSTRFTSPPAPKSGYRAPVFAFSATSDDPTTAMIRASSPSVQYATPRDDPPRRWAPSGAASNHTTSPFVASSAATVPSPVLT